MNVTIGLSFLAGLASFLSPCVFCLVPAYISYLSGRSIASTSGQNDLLNRWGTLTHGLAFVFGFSVIFISLGLAASALGKLLFDISPWLSKIGGIIVILFGLHMTGILRIPFLEYDLRPQSRLDQQRSYFSSAMMGVFFSAGWAPCVGPVLGSILTMALNGGSLSEGIKLLSAYSAGLAIPFLAAAVGIGWVTRILSKYNKVMHYAEVGMGVVLIAVGTLLFLGIFQRLAQLSPFFNLGI
jgi:cytochrome c-type biogenesis protein